jgi:hypothetical protein
MTGVFHAQLLCGGDRESRLDAAKVILKEHFAGDEQAATRIDAGAFEDLLILSVDDDRREITVDKIARLTEFLSAKPFASTSRAALIVDGDAMNESAQNKLLKALEEPAVGDLIIILAENPERLLPTVRSRTNYKRIVEAETATGYAESEEDVRRVLRALIFGAGSVAEALKIIDSYDVRGETAAFLDATLRFLRDLAVGGFSQELLENAELGEAAGKLRESEKKLVIQGIIFVESAIGDIGRGFRAKNAAHSAAINIVRERETAVKE